MSFCAISVARAFKPVGARIFVLASRYLVCFVQFYIVGDIDLDVKRIVSDRPKWRVIRRFGFG